MGVCVFKLRNSDAYRYLAAQAEAVGRTAFLAARAVAVAAVGCTAG